MRRFLVVAAAAIFPAIGAQAETLWIGNAFVTASTQACGSAAQVGDFWRAIYRPANLDNGANSNLSLTTDRANVVMRVPNNTFRTNINYGGRWVSSTISLGTHTGGIAVWDESASFAGNPVTVAVTARLANFFGVSGCSATLQINFTRLP